MTPRQVYNTISHYIGGRDTIICDLHSACSPIKGMGYMCAGTTSTVHVIDSDSVKIKADVERGVESRKSVDAVVSSPSGSYFCFVELKSWGLLLAHNGDERRIRKQAHKYKSDLPEKLAKSLEICKQVTRDNTVFNDCRVIYILITDIPVGINDSAILSIDSALTALAGTSSNLNKLCNQLSTGVMAGIPNVETRYWECRRFDAELSRL